MSSKNAGVVAARHGALGLLLVAVLAKGCGDDGEISGSRPADGPVRDAGADSSKDSGAEDAHSPADAADETSVDPFAWWESERALRQQELDDYLSSHKNELGALLYAPIGELGVPRETLERFSSVMPDIWGPPEEKFAAVGLGPDLYDPSNTLPLGIATYTSLGREYATFSCGTCHVGRVVGPDGQQHLLFGAPNTRFNAVFFAFEDTANDPRWLALGGGVPAATIQQALKLRRQVEERTIEGYTFDPQRHPDTPAAFARNRPGFFDSFAVIFAMQAMPEALTPGGDAAIAQVMPPAPGEADIMSLWLQRDRPVAEWDGSLPHPVYRNLAASLGAVGFGQVVNYDTAATVAQLAENLPPPPYPFEVDGVRAERGRVLFDQYCGGCHYDGAQTIYPAAVTGTDPNRALSVTTEGRARLLTALRNSCTDPAVCNVPDNQVVAEPTLRGYMALPLRGIWARAPYLHNGSVPTLRQLLLPETRPARFFRGAIQYDTANVGFVWDERASQEKYTHEYDTSLAGRSNHGHADATFLGLNWQAHPEELEDLLEYLKTL